MASDPDRLAVLRALVRGECSPRVLVQLLAGIPFDSPTPLVLIGRADIRDMLARAVDGSVPNEQVQEWAELLEGREDLGHEAGHEDLLASAVFELANPLLTGLPLIDLHRSWLARLTT